MQDLQSTLERFSDLSDAITKDMGEAIRLVAAGIAPTAETSNRLLGELRELRETYDEVRSAASDGAHDGDVPVDGLPVTDYAEIARKKRDERLREAARPVIDMLDRFCSITSENEMFESAFAPFRDEAAKTLESLEEGGEALERLDDSSDGLAAQEALVSAVASEDLATEDGAALVGEIAKAYPIQVQMGVLMGQYRFAEPYGDGVSKDGPGEKLAGGEKSEGDSPVEQAMHTAEPGRTRPADAVESVAANADAPKAGVAEGRSALGGPSVQRRLSVSAFKKMLGKPGNGAVGPVFAGLARFGCLTEAQAVDLYRISSGRGEDDPSVGPSVSRAMGRLESKGIIEELAAGGTSGPRAFRLSKEGRTMAGKDSVALMRDNRGRKPWPFGYRDERCTSALDSDDQIRNVVAQNDLILSYLEKRKERSARTPMERLLWGVDWRDGHYVARCRDADGKALECLLVRDLAAAPDDGEAVLALEDPSPEDAAAFTGRVFLINGEGNLRERKSASPTNEDRGKAREAATTPKAPEIEEGPGTDGDAQQGAETAERPTDQRDDTGEPTSPAREDVPREGVGGDDTPLARARWLLEGTTKVSDDGLADLARDIASEGGGQSHEGLEVAVALLASVRGQEGFDRSTMLCRQLSLAVDSPLGHQDYTGEAIATAFPTYDDESRGLALAAYCLGMLRPANAYDYAMHDACKAFLDSYDDVFAPYGCVKALFGELTRVWDVLPEGGFTPGVVAAVGDEAKRRRDMEDIRTEAAKLIEEPTFKAMVNGLPAFSKACFGKGSDLSECMEIIASDKRDMEDLVREEFERFAPKGTVDDGKVEEAIDEGWQEARRSDSSTRVRKLGMFARDKACDAFRVRLGLMGRWLDHGAISRDEGQLDRVRALRSRLAALSKEALDGLPLSDNSIGTCALRVALEQLECWLSGSEEGVLTFKDFLRTGRVATGPEGLPSIDPRMSGIAHCEPWRAVLEHYLSEKPSLEDARERIGNPASDTFDNLGQLAAIERALGVATPGAHSEKVAQGAEAAADQALGEFNDDLEISFTYNRIGEVEKESLGEYARAYRERFYGLREFGCWRRFLEGLKRQINDLSASHYHSLEARLIDCRSKLGDGESELLEEAEHLLTDENNLIVVEEYLNRFDAGERELPERASRDAEGPGAFEDFVSSETFQPLFELCRSDRNKGRALSKYAINYLQEHFPGNWTVRQRKSSETLMRNWPSSQSRARAKIDGSSIGTLLKGLGINVRQAYGSGPTGREVHHVLVRSAKRDRETYGHPIAAFGTQMREDLQVLVLYGNQTPMDIVKAVTDEGLGDCSIVLVDYAISLGDRRKLAELYHRQQSTMPCFLVIDQVLLLYLALHEEAERLSVLLQCTLPFTSYQPFVRDGGATSDEMFCGRTVELKAITDSNGAGLVYGGRQLGKTALLQRARSLRDRPEHGQHAVYVSILRCDTEAKLVDRLAGAFSRAKIDLGDVSTLCGVCDAIDSMIGDGRIKSLLLLMDEADDYLASISGDRYVQLQPLVDLRRERSGSFKFVLAGLHNVSRAKNATAENGIIGQLGAPLCIKPLEPASALRLISRPLTYLGFQMDRYPHLETILASTNYYPGILQFFGYILVETMSSRYGEYYRAQDGNPPYPLTQRQLGAIISRNDLNNSIRDKFRLSLELDPRYLMIARCVALEYYMSEDEGGGGNLEGYSSEDVKRLADEFGIHALENETVQSCGNLMDEMVDMYILVRPQPAVRRYRLRRHAFLSIIGGSADEIVDDIAQEQAEEES